MQKQPQSKTEVNQRLEKRRPWARREKFIPTSKLEPLSGKALVGEENRSVGRELGKRAEQGPCQEGKAGPHS